MKMIIHDLTPEDVADWTEGDRSGITLISDNGTIRGCTGCFGCWTRTPGICVIKDDYQHLGELLARTDELQIVSRMMYGSYSPFIVNVLNRSISYMLPYFVTKHGETHHRRRYPNKISLAVHFYGEATDAEQQTAQALVAANALNLDSSGNTVSFYPDLQAVKEALA
ncbi:hypothetical protein D3C73_1158310 [compost metagenome]